MTRYPPRRANPEDDHERVARYCCAEDRGIDAFGTAIPVRGPRGSRTRMTWYDHRFLDILCRTIRAGCAVDGREPVPSRINIGGPHPKQFATTPEQTLRPKSGLRVNDLKHKRTHRRQASTATIYPSANNPTLLSHSKSSFTMPASFVLSGFTSMVASNVMVSAAPFAARRDEPSNSAYDLMFGAVSLADICLCSVRKHCPEHASCSNHRRPLVLDACIFDRRPRPELHVVFSVSIYDINRAPHNDSRPGIGLNRVVLHDSDFVVDLDYIPPDDGNIHANSDDLHRASDVGNNPHHVRSQADVHRGRERQLVGDRPVRA